MKINDKYLIKNVNQEVEAVKSVLEQVQLSGTGKIIDRYESKLANFFGSKKALVQSSGSAALHTALYCLGIKKGDEVLIPAIAPIPTVLPILTAKAIPVIVDIKKDGLCFDPQDLKRKITSKTKAAILVPLWGYPIDYSETLTVLNNCDIPLIEDAAQAHGTRIGKRFIGTFGKVGCFSTHDRKLLSTGEGGFILTNDELLYKKMKQFSQLGYMDGKTYGVNYKLSALQAGLGLFRLTQIQAQIRTRKRNVATIEKFLKGTKITVYPSIINGMPNYYSLVLLLPWEKEKNYNFIKALNDKGIPSDIIKYGFCPIYERPMFNELKTDCPNATWLIDRITTIPVHPGLSKNEVSFIAHMLQVLYKKFEYA